ncbi:TPA: transcriptional regulator [Yersinia enterocolitica]|uniref:transcriptional regulator n=1 Tax=Yersinia enterocolitica TaxID=630 RepID=UPI000200B583|nr:transcriptional regulator [Yersinia enterocolitica]QCW23326.1 hypothetical protein [Yersinia phage YeP4]QCW23552.1 hypothetical protein [Yersinia phage YeP5]QCW23590.1 hypothetical protein [Yersinia phage YeP6]ADZ41840.1 hypothetical protein YE105_C1344 [Yersinia enterocolitica subsp. palearctica 105.5R(r)]HDL7391435.1 transcriptional regulator [Yersinia enterocolitica]
MQIDWFQVITDVERSGMTQQQIAKGIHVAKATLFGWKQGSNPRYDDGEALIRLWELVTDKNLHDLPYSNKPASRFRKR